MEVKASLTELNPETNKRETTKSITCEVNIPDTLEAKVDAFGSDVVNNAVEDSLVISVQALMRRHLNAGKTEEEIQKAVSEWKPEVRTAIRQSAFEKASSSITKLSAEERAELLRKLQEAA